MNTSRPISTISYNSKMFLDFKLKELSEKHLVSDFMYIIHTAEDDELKDHIHLFLKPNKKLDTMSLQEFFEELDPERDRPLGCIDFRTSKSEDWIPYVLHDAGYLKYKHESRKYKYNKDDMVVKDPDNYNQLYIEAFRCSKWSDKVRQLDKLLDPDLTAKDLIDNGTFDFMQTSQLLAYERLKDRTYRNGRKNHEDHQYNDID